MPKWVWILLAIAAVGALAWYFMVQKKTLPSGNVSTADAALNPTVATTSYGR